MHLALSRQRANIPVSTLTNLLCSVMLKLRDGFHELHFADCYAFV